MEKTFTLYSLDGQVCPNTIIKVSPKFQIQMGCLDKCPIQLHETTLKSEICCMNGRECCFTCFEEECPIKEIYRDIIHHYLGE